MPYKLPVESVDSESVAHFLQANPDYFTSEAGRDLLRKIDVLDPDKGDSLSLLEYQVRLLRAESNKYARDLSSLAEIAANNKDILDELQIILIAAISAESFFDLVTTYERKWSERFGISTVRTLSFERSYPGLRNRQVVLEQAPDALHEAVLMDEIKAFGGSDELSDYIGDQEARIRSWCALPLTVERSEFLQLQFVICFGSKEPDGFTEGTDGTTLLQFMRGVLQVLMAKQLSKMPL